MLVRVLLILSQRKHLSQIAHWKGYKEIMGGTVVHGRKAFRGLKYPGLPRHDIPRPTHPVSSQTYPPHLLSQSRDIWLSRPLKEEI